MYLRNSHRVTFRLPYHGSVILFSFKPNHCFQFDWEKAVWKYFEKKNKKKCYCWDSLQKRICGGWASRPPPL